MRTRNNYDQSSSGVNIRAECYYDYDKSRYEFEENFMILQHSSYSKSIVAYYIDNGNVKGADSLFWRVTGTPHAIVKYARENYTYYADTVAADGQDLEDIKDEILNSLCPSILNIDDINDYQLKNSGLSIEPIKTLESVEIRGYCQGDYARVYYCVDDLREAWGNEPDAAQLKEIFTHYFYDAPIYAQVTINGEEYFYHDCPDYDEYEFKRDEFIQYVVKESGINADSFADLIPLTPDC